eukprot:m.40954 g.40954  ORF g.40954 m.40954 type:complete len:451 (+) comp6051_c0_seq1:278-1630(+)
MCVTRTAAFAVMVAVAALTGLGSATPARPLNTICNNTVAFLIGGQDDKVVDGSNNTVIGNPLNVVEELEADPVDLSANGVWTDGVNLTGPRTGMASASIQLLDDEAFIFVAGGRSSRFNQSEEEAEKVSRSVLEYVYGQQRWANLPQMPSGRVDAGMAAVVLGSDYRVFVVGGKDPQNPEANVTTLVFSVGSRSWSQVDRLNVPRSGLAVASVREVEDTDTWAIYAAGGWDYAGDPSDAVERYDVNKNEWKHVAVLSMSRAYLGLVAVDVGNVSWYLYAMGGTADGKTPMGIVEKYPLSNPADGWTETKDMGTPAWGFAAVPMEDDQGAWVVRVIGGANADGKLSATTQLFEPDTDTWKASQPFPTPRNHLVAATVCTSALTNTSDPVVNPSDTEEIDDLEIILGACGGVVLLILVVGTVKLMQAGEKKPRMTSSSYHTFAGDGGTNTDI